MRLIKKSLWFLIGGTVIVIAPIVINWAILQPQKFEVVGNSTDWLGFWVTYISAIASFAMVAITWYSLRESKRQNKLILQESKVQLDELKRQWHEANKPLLEISVLKEREYPYVKFIPIVLLFKNIGSATVENITFEIDPIFLAGITHERTLLVLKERIINMKLRLLPNEQREIRLFESKVIPCYAGRIENVFEKFKTKQMTVTIKYGRDEVTTVSVDLEQVTYLKASTEEMIYKLAGEVSDLKKAYIGANKLEFNNNCDSYESRT